MRADDLDRCAGRGPALQPQAQKIEDDDAVLLLGLVAEGGFVADRDAMFVAADLATPGPEGAVENDLMRVAAPAEW